jgi:hypothetical protein
MYLTYQPTVVNMVDRPTQREEPEIKVTPEMIEAGVSVLWESGAIENPMDGVDQILVQKIFVAMSLRSRDRS